MTLSERSDSLGTDSLTAVALVTPVLLLMQNMPQGAMGAGKSIVFSMLADDSALHAALSGDDGLLAGLRKGALHVSLSTIAVATADQVAALHHKRGQRYVSAPVIGRPDAAAAGRLFIAAAGAVADLDQAEPVFAAIGQKMPIGHAMHEKFAFGAMIRSV
jgi:3-hydroxyisobutyrate dehydrogenase-like beta-hydroxyacid dehydrogenase